MKVLVSENNLTGIANAIRGKNGSTTTYKPSEMAAAITAISGGGPDIPESAFVISGNCTYRFAYNGWNWFIEQYGDRITTQNIANASYMFYFLRDVASIPFKINLSNTTSSININYMFSNSDIINVPDLNDGYTYTSDISGVRNIFEGCSYIRYIPDDFFNILGDNLSYGFSSYHMFSDCKSIRKLPSSFYSKVRPNNTSTYINKPYANMVTDCSSIDEVIGLYVDTNTMTRNLFNNTFDSCYRLKNFTFETDDSTTKIANWKTQTIDLSYYLGYAKIKQYIINFNSGITADKEVTDDATYQALKNDADWFTTKVEYSRYNHDSAVSTINSLPNTSAYLASAGGTNTIKFKGAAGSATDGGAINTLTEEEIAVATAKGWTVSLV